ncbi:MAG: PspA/IM30 family protein [Oceanococcus sp.]
MPGLWKRMEDMFTANSHAALDQVENPAHMSQQLLRELDAELDTLRPRLVECLATERKINQSRDKLNAQLIQHEKRAQSAILAKDETTARQQLRMKLQLEQEHEQLGGMAEQQAQWVAALKEERDELLREREELSSQARLISLRNGLRGSAATHGGYGQSLQRRERMTRYAERSGNGLNQLMASQNLRREELQQNSRDDEFAVDQALQQLKAETLEGTAA